MFLYEKDLKDAFWEKYRVRDNILSHSFEIGRQGGTDLITFEELNGNYEINSFEFKLEDIKRAILQAKHNLKFSHKSWIVLPIEKEELIRDKYLMELKKLKNVGVIGVKEDGYYSFLLKPYKQDDRKLSLNQELFKLIGGR